MLDTPIQNLKWLRQMKMGNGQKNGLAFTRDCQPFSFQVGKILVDVGLAQFVVHWQ